MSNLRNKIFSEKSTFYSCPSPPLPSHPYKYPVSLYYLSFQLNKTSINKYVYIFVSLPTTFLDKPMYMIHTFQSNPRDCTGQYIKCKRQINDIQRKPYVVKKKKKSHWGCWRKLGNLLYTHFTLRRRHCMKHRQGQKSGLRQFNTTQGVCVHQQPYQSDSKVLFLAPEFCGAKVSIINYMRNTWKEG